jgi:hypothetical protein
MTWGNDLAFGQKYEMKLVEYLKPDSYELKNNNEYDVLAIKNGKETKYEVKADRMMNKTNNICIEFECSKKPSGIQTTQAEYYAYFDTVSETLYLIPVRVIKESILATKYTRTINGGDGYKARLHLFPKEVFSEYKVEWK